jgi:hypothetical protein
MAQQVTKLYLNQTTMNPKASVVPLTLHMSCTLWPHFQHEANNLMRLELPPRMLEFMAKLEFEPSLEFITGEVGLWRLVEEGKYRGGGNCFN